MRIGIMVDSACDLPADFIADHGILVAPITVRFGERTFSDVRDPELTARVYARELDGKSGDYAESEPAPAEALHKLLWDRILDYDYVYLLTIASSRSKVNEAARASVSGLVVAAVQPRYKAGMKDLFKVEVVDSRSLFSAQGVQVLKLIELVRELHVPAKIGPALQSVIDRTVGYAVPDDLQYLYQRARRRNDRSLNWLSYSVGSLLDVRPVVRALHGITEPVAKVRTYEAAIEKLGDIVLRDIGVDRLEPLVNFGYGGAVEELAQIKPYRQLKSELQKAGMRVYESQMGIIGGMYMGRRTLSVGLLRREAP